MNLKKKFAIIFIIFILVGVLVDEYLLRDSNDSTVNYFPYINGSIFLVAGIYAALLTFRIYQPKYKNVEQALKVDNLLRTWGNTGKFSSIFMIFFGAYNLIWHDPNMYRLNSTIENNKWTKEDRAAMIKNCMNGAVVASKKYPQITLDYCTCSIDKIIEHVSRKDYIKNSSNSVEGEYKIDSPFIQGCVITFTRKVDSIKKQETLKK